MKDGKFDGKTFLNNVELYISACLFIALTVLLFANVVGRYVFGHSFAWVEELATIAFVWMIWFAISAAVTKRKHLRIDFVLEMVPFKVKKGMLIISNAIFAVFDIYLGFIENLVVFYLENSGHKITLYTKRWFALANHFFLCYNIFRYFSIFGGFLLTLNQYLL